MNNTVNNSTDNSWDVLKNSTIMLVDDEPVMLHIVRALLEEAGYENFITVEHSPKAIPTMEEGHPDILLLDLDMPELDGFQVLKQIRDHERFHHLPVIILTAAEAPESKLVALELGATDFLSKPVDPSELALRVRNTLSAKAYQDQLAFYDNLTGLPNTQYFLDLMSWSLQSAKREKNSLVLMDIGLDRIKNINESMGMSVGDQVQQVIADRLKQVIRGSDLVGLASGQDSGENIARISGEEFSIVLNGLENVDKAILVCLRVLEAIKEPININGSNLYVNAGIGMSVYPDDGEDVETLVKNARAAMEAAKQQGTGKFLYYSSEMNAKTLANLKMESDLKRALEKDEFELYFQPKIEVKTGRTVGVESLVRWNHPEDGLVSPTKFIPIAEKLGLIVPLGEWVLDKACACMSQLNAHGFADLKVSVNVAAQQFEDITFQDAVAAALARNRLNPNNLILEITESSLMGDFEQNIDVMQQIRRLGVAFSLDDFGTGYSSLNYLRRFPISELKIDRSFLTNIRTKREDRAIVAVIIALAHSLGQKVVAEGVEEEIQLKFLEQRNCDIIQGFYFSKPLSFNNLKAFLRDDSELATG
ncbi:MAG: EAL domain-containing protein [Gammaproteobacteria bacterium]|nr:EAL domain-containing protein [Gammaproteobacteria bacterium]